MIINILMTLIFKEIGIMKNMRSKLFVQYSNVVWLLLFTLFISVNFGCSGARSIRGGSIDLKSKTTPVIAEVQENDIKTEEIKPISSEVKKAEIKSEVIKPIIAEKKDYSKLADIVGDRLPTIREQMQSLAGSQDSIKSEMTKMKNDIEEIKFLLSDLKGTIEDYIPAGTRLPMTGKPTADITPKSDNTFKLVADEKANSEPVIKTKKESKQTMAKKAMSETFLQSDEKAKPIVANNKAKSQTEVQTTSVQSNNETFSLGKENFKNRNYKSAIENLTQALKTETSKKQESEINYYLGESYYFMNNLESSIEHLNKVLSVPESSFLDAARIRKAEANLKSGKVKEAKADYQALINNHPGSNYIPKAKKMLQQL